MVRLPVADELFAWFGPGDSRPPTPDPSSSVYFFYELNKACEMGIFVVAIFNVLIFRLNIFLFVSLNKV